MRTLSFGVSLATQIFLSVALFVSGCVVDAGSQEESNGSREGAGVEGVDEASLPLGGCQNVAPVAYTSVHGP